MNISPIILKNNPTKISLVLRFVKKFFFVTILDIRYKIGTHFTTESNRLSTNRQPNSRYGNDIKKNLASKFIFLWVRLYLCNISQQTQIAQST